MKNNTLFDLFKAKAEAMNAEVHRFSNNSEALSFIIDTLKKEQIMDKSKSYAVWADCPFLEGVDKEALSREVSGLKFNITKSLAADAKIGISQMQWALAGTGTLVQNSTAIEQRLVSTLTEIHIAIINAGEILPDLSSVLSKISPDKAEFIAFITGPSRTADIERVLTIGVHGPERLIIVCVDGEGKKT